MTENHSAIESYTRVGFKVEGTLREAFYLDGRFVDALYMGLLQSEFVGADV